VASRLTGFAVVTKYINVIFALNALYLSSFNTSIIQYNMQYLTVGEKQTSSPFSLMYNIQIKINKLIKLKQKLVK